MNNNCSSLKMIQCLAYITVQICDISFVFPWIKWGVGNKLCASFLPTVAFCDSMNFRRICTALLKSYIHMTEQHDFQKLWNLKLFNSMSIVFKTEGSSWPNQSAQKHIDKWKLPVNDGLTARRHIQIHLCVETVFWVIPTPVTKHCRGGKFLICESWV